MKFLNTIIDDGFGKNMAEPYPLSTKDDAMQSHFICYLLENYLNNNSAVERRDKISNIALGTRILKSNALLKEFDHEISKHPELVKDLVKARILFFKVLSQISKYNIKNTSVNLSLSESLIIRFKSNESVFDLEIFFDDDEDLEAILFFKSWDQEPVKEYGKLHEILESLDQKIIGQNNGLDTFQFSFELPESTFAQTA